MSDILQIVLVVLLGILASIPTSLLLIALKRRETPTLRAYVRWLFGARPRGG